ncbi:MAG: hypothetical protein N2235_07000 [Fischerella sp.]|nr:hypothetical protein [Fischerella sp.]
MKSLLIVTTIPATLRAFFIPITHHFQSQGWRVDGMAKEILASSECLKAFNQVWDVELSRNPLKPQNLMVASQQIQRVVEKEKYDLVLVSTPVAAFVTRFALNGLRKQGKLKICLHSPRLPLLSRGCSS